MQLVMENLGKTYRGGKIGLDHFSLTLEPGILGLLGPNGAGKSTLLRILATVSKPSTGSVSWNGTDIVRKPNVLRRVLGYLPQDFGVYPHLNAVEFLEYMAAIKGLSGGETRSRIEALLEQVNLAHVRKQPIGSYSGGMKQRIGIAQVLLSDPELMILDEPTVGLDPEERVRFRQLLSHLSGERIIILSSHIVSDIETIAGDIAIICNGRLLNRGVSTELTRHVQGRVFEMSASEETLEQIRARHLVSNFLRLETGWHIRFVAMDPAGVAETGARSVQPTLEDAYLYLTGNGNRSAQ